MLQDGKSYPGLENVFVDFVKKPTWSLSNCMRLAVCELTGGHVIYAVVIIYLANSAALFPAI